MSFFEMTDWQKWAPACRCEPFNGKLVTKLIARGRQQLALQCDSCAALGMAIGQKMLSEQERQEAARRLVDLAERQAAQEERSSVDRYCREKENEDWWRRYTEYLGSDDWKGKRLSILERDKYVCQACLKHRAVQAHHLTYRHVFREPLFDLVAVCVRCHEAITAMERQAGGVPLEVPFDRR